MSKTKGQYFRGDELPGTVQANVASSAAAANSAPAAH